MLKKITLVTVLAVLGSVGYVGAASAHTTKLKTAAPIAPQALCPWICCAASR